MRRATARAALVVAALCLVPGRVRAEHPIEERRGGRPGEVRAEEHSRVDHPERRAGEPSQGLRESRRRRGRTAEPTPDAAAEARGWRSASRRGLTLPHGVSLAMLSELVSTVRTDPAFREAEAVVLYGSRTHHKAGYAPTADSDLDVTTFSRADTPILEQLDTYEAINRALAPIGKRAGFKVAQELPQGHSFTGAIAEKGLFWPRSLAREQTRWQKIADHSARGHWGRERLKRFVLDQDDRGTFGKEALILVREGPGAKHQIARLRRRGYANIATARW